MSVLDTVNPTRAIGVTENAKGLRQFLEPGCSAAIWNRQIPGSVQAWLDQLDPAVLPAARVSLPREAVAQTVSQLCDIAGLPESAERTWLEADITSLADTFADLMGCRYLRLRLDVVTTNACRKFHVDAITARLVCTYRGTGTQYGLGQHGTDPSEIFTVNTGSPILLRGTKWLGESETGVLHRSPPIEGTGETRLVLVLDPVETPQNDLAYSAQSYRH